MLTLPSTLLVKYRTHYLYLFSQLPMTCTLLNAVYRVTLAISDQIPNVPQLWWNLEGLRPLPTRGDKKKRRKKNSVSTFIVISGVKTIRNVGFRYLHIS